MINFIRYDVMSQFGWFDVIGYCYQISILFVINIYFCYLQLYPEQLITFLKQTYNKIIKFTDTRDKIINTKDGKVVLSVLLFTDSDYPFGIVKLFLRPQGRCHCWNVLTPCPWWPSCSDLFIMGDMRVSILADLRKFMHLIRSEQDGHHGHGVKTFDFSTLYTTIPHSKPKDG
jgi:hypothetical protein